MSEFPRFAEGTTVRLTTDYDAVANEYDEAGEQIEHEVEITDPKAVFEIVSTDYDGGFVYNLRLDGTVDEYDYIRIFGVDESDIERL
jgi:hypothetical protein